MARLTEKTIFLIVGSTGESDQPGFYLNFVFAMQINK